MKLLLALTLLGAIVVGGCPAGLVEQVLVNAKISASTSRGAAPLTVVFSAGNSVSPNGGTLTYKWDFDDGTTSTEANPIHEFEEPGRYIVKLTVTDSAGDVGIATLDVRVEGQGVVAVIATDTNSGTAPLTVSFDATQSISPEDQIIDYHWDFGDSGESYDGQTTHKFNFDGVYEVTLTVRTAGGLEATTRTTITVGSANGSLQFDGSSFATLPPTSAAAGALDGYTFEAWVKAEADGGTLATVGSGALRIALDPGANQVAAEVGGQSIVATALDMVRVWHHIAVVYEPPAPVEEPNGGEEPGGEVPGGTSDDGRLTIYIDGVPLGTGAVSGTLPTGSVLLGTGFRGKIGEVRLWNAARSAAQLGGTFSLRLAGGESGLIGYWPLTDGSGQTLINRVFTPHGTLGASQAVETTDPAWSAEGPPL